MPRGAAKAAVRWMLAAWVALAAAPLLACPTSPAGSGYALTDDKGQTRLEIRAVEKGVVRIARYGNGRLLALTDYRDGLFPVAGYSTAANDDPRVAYRYEPPDPRLDLRVGASLRYRLVSRQSSEERIDDTRIEVSGEETVELGACRYRVLVLERSHERVGGGSSDKVRAFFSPDLKWVLRSRIERSDGRVTEMAYTRIEPGRKAP